MYLICNALSVSMITVSLAIYFLMPLTSPLCLSLGSLISLIFSIIFTFGLLVCKLWGVLALIIFLVMFPLEVPVPPGLLVSRILPVFGSINNKIYILYYNYYIHQTFSFTSGMSNAPCCSLFWVFPFLSLFSDTNWSLIYSLIVLPCQWEIVLVLWAFTRKFF